MRTTDDVVETPAEVVAPDLATPAAAVRCLRDAFGPRLEADYVPGKTEMRDALSRSLDVSELVAEELCDELERAGWITFVRQGESFGWHIDAGEPWAPR